MANHPNLVSIEVRFSYTTPSTVKEVSAMFVATINLLQLGGGGLKTRTCIETKTYELQVWLDRNKVL